MASTTPLPLLEGNDIENEKVKMNKKAKLRQIAELKQSQTPNHIINMYLVPRKLLIFDINKVLLHRKAKTSHFEIRPHAHAFIAGMSERFTLAVWTSMTKKSAKPILWELFPDHGAPLLFNWYQNRCVTIPDKNPALKPLFLKELSTVWKEFLQFNESNTILVDDSSEKCVNNPIHTSIHPRPYEKLRPSSHGTYHPWRGPPQYEQGGSTSNNPVGVDYFSRKRDVNEIDLDDVEEAEAGAVTSSVLPEGCSSSQKKDINEIDLDETGEVNSAADVTELPPASALQPEDHSPVDTVPAPETEGPAPLLTAEEVSPLIPPAGTADSAAATSQEIPFVQHPPYNPYNNQYHDQYGHYNQYNQHNNQYHNQYGQYNQSNNHHDQYNQCNNYSNYNQYNQHRQYNNQYSQQGTVEDNELMPGGPLWEYLDQLARLDGPVQEIYAQRGPYRFA